MTACSRRQTSFAQLSSLITESDQRVPLGQIVRLTCADTDDFQLWMSLERDVVRLRISERASLGGTDSSAGFGKLLSLHQFQSRGRR